MTKRNLLIASAALLLAAVGFGQTVTTPSAPPSTTSPARGRGRGFGRAPTTGPGMVKDPATGQYFTPMHHAEYAFGADLSSTFGLEASGKVFKDVDGTAKPAVQILKDHGYNWVRLRVCVEPATLPQTTEYTVAAAKRVKALGMHWLLDIHYSNAWADPTNEPTPRAWQGLSHAELVKTLYEYTRDTIAAFAKEDALPDIIQVGNEVSNGFLWPNAKLPEHWDDFADLIYAGINGIDAGRGNHVRPKIMIHVDHGGNVDKTRAFFDKLNSYDIPYDMIGFSFYPWSHGNLLDLKANLAFASQTYGKDVMVVETGYYYEPSRYFRQTPGPFPETPEGQAQWLDAVNNIVMNVPGGRGKGVFWWEPASNGGLVGRGYFDRDGNVEPIIHDFERYTRPAHRTDNQ
ncbi:MAG TPA: glycosyl hydrolase 53 family protein [Phycisphaerae bacterium]|jgi:arabinogalactan endo-1,4-beta-galactosidase|nr:glycosyl hydrolase 53 family protein [Phycisphaerae bacterium]